MDTANIIILAVSLAIVILLALVGRYLYKRRQAYYGPIGFPRLRNREYKPPPLPTIVETTQEARSERSMRIKQL